MYNNKLNLLKRDLIQKYTNNVNIFVKKYIDSTNQYIKKQIPMLKSGDTCFAEFQSLGRGKTGSIWFSPFGCNLYFTMYWNINQKKTTTSGLSILVGIVVAEILNKFSNKKIKVKWPNDLYMNNKKLAGILIELLRSSNNLIHVIIGIGINIEMNKNIFLNKKWISLKEEAKNIEKNEISINIVNGLINSLILFEKNGLKPFIEKWFELDIFLNQKINFFSKNNIYSGIERGINNNGELLIEDLCGKINSYTNGKIF